MADPLSITTAIITLGNTLDRAITLLANFKNAPNNFLDIKRDCDITQGVLEVINQQIKHTALPTLRIDGDQDASGVNLARLLQDNVHQLQLDLNTLVDELERLSSPSGRESKIGGWMLKGAIGWQMPNLLAMQQKIVTKRTQLQLVQSTLQSQENSRPPLSPHAGRDGTAAMLIDIINIFYPTTTSQLRRRISTASGSISTPNYAAQDQLIRAVRDGKRRDAEIVLKQIGIDPNFHSNDEEELPPLCIAAKNGDLAMIELLLAQGAFVNCYSKDFKTPLIYALLHNYPVAALALIRRGADILHSDARGSTALHHAVLHNLYAVVQVLLSNGADPNAYDKYGETPLMKAVRRDDRDIQPHDTGVLRSLLENPTVAANPTLGTLKYHYNPVHHSARKGYLPDITVIAASTASRRKRACSAPDALGRAPLWFAARYGQLDVLNFLLSLHPEDANLVSRDTDNPTALWAMVSSSSPPSKADPAVTDPEVILAGVAALLAAGADPNARKAKGRTLLHRASGTGDAALMSLLLEHGADPRIADDDGKQPLHYAAGAGLEESAELLLQWRDRESNQGVDIDCVDKAGETPLMAAAGSGHDFLVRFLVEYGSEDDGEGGEQEGEYGDGHNSEDGNGHGFGLKSGADDGKGGKRRGADWTKRDLRGCDAFYAACSWSHILCATYLLGKGADINGRNLGGNTPIHAAVRTGRVDAVRWLLRMGADRHAVSDKPFEGLEVAGTPAEVARAVGGEMGESIARMIEKWEPRRRRDTVWRVGVEAVDGDLEADTG